LSAAQGEWRAVYTCVACWPGLVTEITPAHKQLQVHVLSSAG
jgi:hypothetical protein